MNNPKTLKLLLTLYSHLCQEPEIEAKHSQLFTALINHSDVQGFVEGEPNTLNLDDWSNKVIQQVPMKDFNSLYIVDFDVERMLLSIRKSNSLNLVEVLAVSINESTVFAPGFDFSVYFLNQFIFNNHEHYDGIIQVRAEEDRTS